MSLTQAAAFNPTKMMFTPFGMDFGAYLSGFGGLDYGSYLGGYNNFGGLGGYSGYGYGGNIGAVNPAGSSSSNLAFYNPGKHYVEDLSINNVTLDLQNRIKTNQSSKIASSWDRYKETIKNTREYKMMAASGDFTEGQILSHVMNKYAQTTGVDIRAEILNNTHGSFFSGLYNGATFGLAKDKSSDQWFQAMFGAEPPRGSELKRHFGVAVGAGATTAALATGAKIVGRKTACTALKSLTKSKIAVLALAAAGLSAAISAFGDI